MEHGHIVSVSAGFIAGVCAMRAASAGEAASIGTPSPSTHKDTSRAIISSGPTLELYGTGGFPVPTRCGMWTESRHRTRLALRTYTIVRTKRSTYPHPHAGASTPLAAHGKASLPRIHCGGATTARPDLDSFWILTQILTRAPDPTSILTRLHPNANAVANPPRTTHRH